MAGEVWARQDRVSRRWASSWPKAKIDPKMASSPEWRKDQASVWAKATGAAERPELKDTPRQRANPDSKAEQEGHERREADLWAWAAARTINLRRILEANRLQSSQGVKSRTAYWILQKIQISNGKRQKFAWGTNKAKENWNWKTKSSRASTSKEERRAIKSDLRRIEEYTKLWKGI